MRWRGTFFISLGLNIALAIGWIISARHQPAAHDTADSLHAPTIKTNVVVRRQFFSWNQVESTDYPTFIANLRSIDCPEQTIRDIIIADVNTLYAQRLATELVTPEQQWWRSEPDSNVVRIATQKARAIDDERRALLTSLLGADWETGDLINLPRPSRPGVALDGPVLGIMPAETKQAVEEISVRSQQRLEALLSAENQGDPAAAARELAKLREQTRNELASVLTPQQLEEYLLRYSQNASNLRREIGALEHFHPSPDEFRSIFRATDTLDQRIQELAGRTDPNGILERNNLEQQREAAIRNALGAERYSQYAALQDPDYRNAVASAQQAGAPDSADTLYQINRAAAEEAAAIRANTNLTATQRAIALKQLELKQMTADALATGHDPLLPDEVPMPPMPEEQVPTIRSHAYVFALGDTIGSIAQRYGVTMNEMRAANPDLDFGKIKAGDTIQVPYSLR